MIISLGSERASERGQSVYYVAGEWADAFYCTNEIWKSKTESVPPIVLMLEQGKNIVYVHSFIFKFCVCMVSGRKEGGCGVDGGANHLLKRVSCVCVSVYVVVGCWSRTTIMMGDGWRSRNINQLTFKRPVFTSGDVFTDFLSFFVLCLKEKKTACGCRWFTVYGPCGSQIKCSSCSHFIRTDRGLMFDKRD